MRRRILLGAVLLALAGFPMTSEGQEPVFVPVPAQPTTPAEPVFVPVPAQPTTAVPVTEPTVEGANIAVPLAPATGYGPTAPEPPALPPRIPTRKGFLARHGLGCFTTHYTMGCGSLESECKFLFGSCRTFFGEPCLCAPPPGDRPPGYTLPLKSHCPCEQ